MTDRRFWPVADGVAHACLQGQIDGVRFVPGSWRSVSAALVDLCATRGGARDRQLLAGTRFCLLTEGDGWAFGFDGDEGYCGWLPASSLGLLDARTHFVASAGTHLYSQPDLKSPEVAALSTMARVQVLDTVDGWARTPAGFIPASHLEPMGEWLADPVAVARGFLGAPYLWGGNSRAGIDCSGLVQVARRACGLACPADSDLQRIMPGVDVPPGEEAPGDLIFWKGHVAMVSAPGRIVHANAHHMAVVEEPLSRAEARIAAKGDPVLRRWRG